MGSVLRLPCPLFTGMPGQDPPSSVATNRATQPLRHDTVIIIYHPCGWWEDGEMTNKVQELRPRQAESEKITINLGYVDLGQVDLLVREGFYSNRTDFIRTAIRNQIDRHDEALKKSLARHQMDLGLRRYSRADLEAAQKAGEMLHIQVLGMAVIAEDVSAELARSTIASLQVLGALQAGPAVKAALADRIL